MRFAPPSLPCLCSLLLSSSTLLTAQSSAPANQLERASLSSGGAEGNALSSDALISREGRYVLFSSDASDLVPGDTNLVRDVFLRDRLTRTTTLISVSTGGVQGNALSSVSDPCPISSDGRYVAFYSDATNLVAGDTNLARDVFVRDLLLGTTTMVSVSSGGVQGNGLSSGPTISGDGRYVAFYSDATNLVTGDTNAVRDCFLRDRQTGTTTRISLSSAGAQGNALSSGAIIAAGGRYVAFYSSADNLVAGDSNAFRDAFVRDTLTNTTTRVSVSSAGVQGNKLSSEPVISDDGRYVCFYSDATNMVAGDTNAVRDVFVRDRQTNTTTRVSVSTTNVQGNARSEAQAISGDGSVVVFDSDATNLVSGDTNLARDTFLRHRTTGKTIRLNESSAGAQGNAASADGSISRDGSYVVFGSSASNLVAGDTNASEDVFVRRLREVSPGQLPLVVDPWPGPGHVAGPASGVAPPDPSAIPVIVVGPSAGAGPVLGVFLARRGEFSDAIETPLDPALLPRGIGMWGYWLQLRGGAAPRWTPASVTTSTLDRHLPE